jgi:hypothetical protein
MDNCAREHAVRERLPHFHHERPKRQPDPVTHLLI